MIALMLIHKFGMYESCFIVWKSHIKLNVLIKYWLVMYNIILGGLIMSSHFYL
jgi:hypothetical protein